MALSPSLFSSEANSVPFLLTSHLCLIAIPSFSKVKFVLFLMTIKSLGTYSRSCIGPQVKHTIFHDSPREQLISDTHLYFPLV